jgi:hypothetical protein
MIYLARSCLDLAENRELTLIILAHKAVKSYDSSFVMRLKTHDSASWVKSVETLGVSNAVAGADTARYVSLRGA